MNFLEEIDADLKTGLAVVFEKSAIKDSVKDMATMIVLQTQQVRLLRNLSSQLDEIHMTFKNR